MHQLRRPMHYEELKKSSDKVRVGTVIRMPSSAPDYSAAWLAELHSANRAQLTCPRLPATWISL